jgi:hypothetical protein
MSTTSDTETNRLKEPMKKSLGAKLEDKVAYLFARVFWFRHKCAGCSKQLIFSDGDHVCRDCESDGY